MFILLSSVFVVGRYLHVARFLMVSLFCVFLYLLAPIKPLLSFLVEIFTIIRVLFIPCFKQCVPYLIAIGTDEEQQMKVKSDQQLSELANKYSMFVQVGSEGI